MPTNMFFPQLLTEHKNPAVAAAVVEYHTEVTLDSVPEYYSSIIAIWDLWLQWPYIQGYSSDIYNFKYVITKVELYSLDFENDLWIQEDLMIL